MAPKVQAKKSAKMAAALANSKARKKNSKRVKDKAQHHVVLDQVLYDRIFKEAATFKLVTVSVLVDRLKINGSVARRALSTLAEEGVIRPVISHSKQKTYTKVDA